MTAEIGIMNNMAVALAADSAVTIGGPNGQKIYNTANKLFALSKFQPVGIMVYGNAMLVSTPWETIIKDYREKLGDKSFGSLYEYAQDFFSFLDNNNNLIPREMQENYLTMTTAAYFQAIIEEIKRNVNIVIQDKKSINKTQTKQITRQVIDNLAEQWDKSEYLPCFDNAFITGYKNRYNNLFNQLINKVFDGLPLNKTLKNQLIKIATQMFVKDRFHNGKSGIVIAGFGENEIFPTLYSFSVECVIDNRVKYKKDVEKHIDHENRGSIIPFAQSEMVHTFISGIDPYLNSMSNQYLSDIFKQYPGIIIEQLNIQDNNLKQNLTQSLTNHSTDLLKSYFDQIQDITQQRFVNPIMEIVQHLPKEELAAMAESLVNLTSFKRKITTTAETVGGPIDVAVISKGDGFIWIKRKHYFKPELNNHFFKNYLKGGVHDWT